MIGQKGVGVVDRGGGIEKHVTEIATRLVGRGHQVTVYTRKAYQQDGRTEYQGVRLVYVPTVYRKNLEAIVHSFLATLHALRQPYDIIHYHGVGPATLAWIPRLLKPHAKVVVTFHSQDRFHQKWSAPARAYLRFGEWASVRFPDACIAVSHTLQVLIRKTYGRQVIFIPNGAEVESVSSEAMVRALGLLPGEYLLNVGRIVPQKGLHTLIAAFKQLDTKKKLVIVGAPSFSERYVHELKRLAASDPRIVFVGQQTGEVLRELYAHCYLYIQPSESEGLAVVVLEAMALGKAVLVSDIPENVEAIKKTGFTFVNKDIPDLTHQLQKLLAEPEQIARMGAQAQEVIRQFFTWGVIAEKVEEVYVSLRH